MYQIVNLTKCAAYNLPADYVRLTEYVADPDPENQGWMDTAWFICIGYSDETNSVWY